MSPEVILAPVQIHAFKKQARFPQSAPAPRKNQNKMTDWTRDTDLVCPGSEAVYDNIKQTAAVFVSLTIGCFLQTLMRTKPINRSEVARNKRESI